MPFIRAIDEQAGPTALVCRCLRSKAMYVTGQMEPDPSITAGNGNCWCNETQNVFGPDGQLVNRQACSSARTCYRPAL